ncbi:MAG: DUF4160 domain-containing protein [Longimicrobiaceae bacterium]
MPVVLRVGGFSFGIFRGDHEPPHVHVRYSGGRLVIEIESERIRGVAGMNASDIAHARRLVRTYRDDLLAAWAERLKKET